MLKEKDFDLTDPENRRCRRSADKHPTSEKAHRFGGTKPVST